MDKKETLKEMIKTITGVEHGDIGFRFSEECSVKIAEALFVRGFKLHKEE